MATLRTGDFRLSLTHLSELSGWQGNRKRAINVVKKTAGYRPRSGNWRINKNKRKLLSILAKGAVRTTTTGCSLASGSHRSVAECWRPCSVISQGSSVTASGVLSNRNVWTRGTSTCLCSVCDASPVRSVMIAYTWHMLSILCSSFIYFSGMMMMMINKQTKKILIIRTLQYKYSAFRIQKKVIPVTRGANGTVSKSHRQYLSDVPVKHEIKKLQKTTTLRTAHTHCGKC